MCGRSRCSLAPERVASVAGVQEARWIDRDKYQPSNNVSPGSWTPVARIDGGDGHRTMHTMKWGLVPSFTKHGDKLDHYRMFNARSETVDSKGVFKRLLPKNRCIVLLNGFYEWKQEAGGKKQPYYVSFGPDDVLQMAGLFDCYTGPDGSQLYTYTILTADSSKPLTWLHDRMPALLPTPEAAAAWLDPSPKDLSALVAQVAVPYGGPKLVWWPVTPAMSRPSYDAPDCWKDVRSKKGSIASFFKPSAKTTPGNAEPSSKSVAGKVETSAQPAAGKAEQHAKAAAPAGEVAGKALGGREEGEPAPKRVKLEGGTGAHHGSVLAAGRAAARKLVSEAAQQLEHVATDLDQEATAEVKEEDVLGKGFEVDEAL